MLELKIAFQKPDCRTLIATFESHSAKLINVVAELLFSRNNQQDATLY